jgi:hypothetical protein
MVSLVGQRDQRVFRVHRELVLKPGNILTMVEWFRDLYPNHGAEIWIYGDATGSGRSGQTGMSCYQLIMGGMRGYPSPVRLKIPESNPPVPDRVNAVNRTFRDEFGEIGVEIDESCEETIADCEGVLRDPRGGIKKTYNSKDIYFWRTHSSDAFGYWVCHAQPVSSEPIAPRQIMQAPSARVTTIKAPTYRWRR